MNVQTDDDDKSKTKKKQNKKIQKRVSGLVLILLTDFV